MSDPLRPMTGEPITRHSRDGRLSPWADPVTGAPGWQITTGSRRLALAVATIVPGGTVHSREKAEWQARLPEGVLTVTALGDDAECCGAVSAPSPLLVLSPCPSRPGQPRWC